MGCGCRNKAGMFIVKLPGGLEIQKKTQAAATAYAAKHPGAKVIKPSSG